MNRKNKLRRLGNKVRVAILTAALLLHTATSNTLLAYAAEDNSAESEVETTSQEDNADEGGDDAVNDGDNGEDGVSDDGEATQDEQQNQEEAENQNTSDSTDTKTDTTDTDTIEATEAATATETQAPADTDFEGVTTTEPQTDMEHTTEEATQTDTASQETTTAEETEIITEEETTEEELTEEENKEAVTLEFGEKQKSSAKSFIRSIDRVKSFVIYARDYTPRTHIDGNIAVKNLNSWLEALKTENNKVGSGYISYIENVGSNARIAVNNGGTIVLGNTNGRLGNDICPNNNNGRLVDLSEVSKTDVSAVRAALQTEGISANFANHMQIDGNLASISTAAKSVSPAQGAAGREAVSAVIRQLESGELSAGDVIAIAINANEIGNEVQELYNKNKNV